MYSKITTKNSKGSDYNAVSQLSKIYFLRLLESKVGKPILEHPNSSYDLFTVLRKFQKESQ